MNLIMSKAENPKIYHHKSCQYKKQIKYYNRVTIDSNIAKRNGYVPCKVCCSMRHIYNISLHNIKQLVSGTGIIFDITGESIYVQTHASIWRIDYIAEELRFVLYKCDQYTRMNGFDDYSHLIFNAHDVVKNLDTLSRCFIYIISYDESVLGYNMMLYNKLSEEQEDIDDLLQDSNIRYEMVGYNLYVLTDIGYWKIRNHNNGLVLYHGNLYPEYENISSYVNEPYHVQENVESSMSLLKYLEYIKGHDDFRLKEMERINEMPARTFEQRRKIMMMRNREKHFIEARRRRKNDEISHRKSFSASAV